MRRRPLACSALAVAAGILIAPAGLSPGTWFALTGTLLVGGLILEAIPPQGNPIRLGGVLILLGYACLGALEAEASRAVDPSDVGEILTRHPSLLNEGVEVRGHIARAPKPCPDRLVEAPCIDVTIDLTRMNLLRIAGPVTGRIRLRVLGFGASEPAALGPMGRGDRIQAFARLFVPHAHGNQGSFDGARHLRGRGIRALGNVKSPRLVRVEQLDNPGVPLLLLRAMDRLGEALADRIDEALPVTDEGRRGAAVGKALLLGDRAHLEPGDSEILRRAGVSHLLAVSGFHVAVLAGLLLLLTRSLGLGQRCRFVVIVPVLVIYLLINHAHTSLDRAVTMATVYFAGRAVCRRPDAFNSIGLAALPILGTEPVLIHDVGFQLTFVATASLLRVVGTEAWAATAAIPNRAAGWACRAVLATVAVMVGTLPLSVMHFNRLTPGALIGNLLIGPLVAISLILLILLEILAILPGEIHVVLGSVIVRLVGSAFEIAGFLGSVPLLSYRRITPGFLLPVLYYAALAAVLLCRKPRLPRRLAAAMLAAAGAVLMAPIDTRGIPAGLRVTVLDVGQGDSALVEGPGGERILVDAGGRTPNGFDIGERVVSRALWTMGIASIGILVVTHPDADHAGGAAAIVRNFRPRLVLVPSGSSSWLDRKAAHPLRRALTETGTAMTEVSDGSSICLRGGRALVLHPGRARTDRASGNEASIVLRLTAGGRAVLLPGDAGIMTEAALGSRPIESDVLKIGHHGSRTSSSARFLDLVRPKIAIISCAPRNRFGHPHPEVLARLEERGLRIFRTDRDGAITVELTPEATLLGKMPADRGFYLRSRRGRDAE